MWTREGQALWKIEGKRGTEGVEEMNSSQNGPWTKTAFTTTAPSQNGPNIIKVAHV